MIIYASRQTTINFSFTLIEAITLSAGDKVDEVAGGASGMDVVRICEIGDWANEGQAVGVYGRGFTAGSLVEVGARDRTWELGIEVDSNEELMEIGRMAERD